MDHAVNHRRAILGKRPKLSDNAKVALAVILLLVAYALAGTLEYNDLAADQAERDAYTMAITKCANSQEVAQ